MQVSAIIVASGMGTRLGGDIPKQFQLLRGKPILVHTLEAFARADVVRHIIVAVPEGYVQHTRELIANFVHSNETAARIGYSKIREIVSGGLSRADSVHIAIKQLPADTEIVLVHDGVRPFVSEKLINAVAESAQAYGAAIAGVPLTDTLKEVNESGQITATPDRKRFWRAQTPQGFTYELIMKAYARGEKDGILSHVTDDSALVERLGVLVKMVEGDAGNIKITTREDLALGEVL